MYAELSSALSSLKTVAELVQAARSLSNYGELLAAVNTVQERLSQALIANAEAAEKQTALLQQVNDLKAELERLVDWEHKARDYLLTQVGSGIFAYIYRPVGQSNQPKHWVCAKCFQAGQLSVLQTEERAAYVCHQCEAKIAPYKAGHLVRIEEAYEE